MKYRIIFNGRYWKVESKWRWWQIWSRVDYFYELKFAEKLFDELVEKGTKQIIKESEWL